MLEPGKRAPPRPGGRRFEILSVLGSGGMGVVYEAIDRDRRRKVALKTLNALDADAILRFKNEFRSLQDIQHPNLVSLGELLEEDGQLFFTMELVRGVEFLEHVRPSATAGGDRSKTAAPGPLTEPGGGSGERRGGWHWLSRHGERYDEARLRAAFAQLASGLAAIHAAHKVHRDIKPSNVLVTPEGRVVILDFGLVVDMAREPSRRDTAIVGTAHFMAPEQAAAQPIGPEADWYSMGVMLYIALTGYYPFQFAPEVAMEFKQQIEPPPPSMMAEGLPADLEELCIDLLRLDPAERPKAREVLARLNAPLEIEAAPISPQGRAFIGRRQELDALGAALGEARSGAALAVLIEGESGLGKSALMRRFLESAGKGALAIAGRCYERESVPYKAVDELIDALGAELSRRAPRELAVLLPPNASLLGAAFPVLKKIEALAAAPGPPPDLVNPHELRGLMFGALRELLCRLSVAQPLVLGIDDLQWSDADSLALLTEVMRPPGAPRLLLVATVRRSPGDEEPPLRSFLAPEAVRRLELGRLPAHEAEELVTVLLQSASQQSEVDGTPRSDVRPSIDVEAVVAEGSGHPLFLDTLVRHRLARESAEGPVKLDDALWARIERLSAPARALLELLAASGRPLLEEVALRALGTDPDDLARRIASLRMANLGRTAGAGPGETAEVFHNRIRETLMARLDPPSKRAIYRRLGEALEASGRGDPEALAFHFRDAGDPEKAAFYAARAGEHAAAALAFDHAARLFRMALDLHPRDRAERMRLYAQRGDALANAGRSAEAAETYLGAARAAPPDEALDLRRRAAENLLRSGHVDEGLARLREVLSAVSMDLPRNAAHALGLLALRRVELRLRGLRFEARRPAEIDPAELAKVDIGWTATLGLALVDPLRAACFQAQHLLLALRAGDSYRAARALALEAVFASASGAPRLRASNLLEQARTAAVNAESPHALALLPACTGASLFFQGRFASSLAALDEAEVLLRERCTGVPWERATTLCFAMSCLWFLGDLRELCRRFPIVLREADSRGDRYLEVTLRTGFGNAYWLVRGEPERAEREAEDATLNFWAGGLSMQQIQAFLCRVEAALYRGEGASARRTLLARWHEIEGAQALRLPLMRVHLTFLRARTALAAAPDRALAGELLAEVERAASLLSADALPGASAMAACLRGAIAARRGQAEAAAPELERAVAGFEAAEMALHAAVARHKLGVLRGEAGHAMAEEAEQWMQEQGAASPAQLSSMLLPGRWEREALKGSKGPKERGQK
ncbi:MAG: protein kinase [Byssovorax sp.]